MLPFWRLNLVSFVEADLCSCPRAPTDWPRRYQYTILPSQALVPTIGLHETEHDCKRIAKLVKCALNTVKRFHKKYLKDRESAALASSALVAAGSSAPALVYFGGSGGAGAAPCGWSAPPAQVILTIVAAHPRLSRHTRSPLLAAPLPGGKGDFEKVTPVAGSRPPGGRSAPPH
jgi:hypothetical protein